MYAIMGITGQIGGVIARTLAAKQPVRAIVRDAIKGRAWSDCGCEVALATIEDRASLVAAFREAEGVFVLVPPNFDPSPEFPEAQAIGETLRAALVEANPARVVYLSTIGAQAKESNLLTQHTIIEKAIGGLPIPVMFLRPAWFMENSSWDVAPAMQQGVIPSFLQPLDRPVPMVATADIGKVAAGLLQVTNQIPIIIVFGANWCGDCKMLDFAMKTGASAPLLSQDFKIVKVNVGHWDKNFDVANTYGVPLEKGIPAVVIISARNEVLYVTREGELANARSMGDKGIYEFFKRVTAEVLAKK